MGKNLMSAEAKMSYFMMIYYVLVSLKAKSKELQWNHVTKQKINSPFPSPFLHLQKAQGQKGPLKINAE